MSDSSYLASVLSKRTACDNHHQLITKGFVKRSIGQALEASGPRVCIGQKCIIEDNGLQVDGEVVGFSEEQIYLMSAENMRGLSAGATVQYLPTTSHVRSGQGLLGRVISPKGDPIDGKGPLMRTQQTPLHVPHINPFDREPITEPLSVGVKAIDGLLTIGRGQRIGLFAGTGVGKSSLLGMMTANTEADVVVIGLLGERGREVQDFIDQNVGQSMGKTVMVASPADETPLMRLNCAYAATAVAEQFCREGKHVLLILDSLSRFAQAQREIGLSMGEPPTVKGYPPSVFTKIPQLVERAGNFAGTGSITAIYTVLTEADDPNDPIADSARGVLDGHIILSRDLAEAGVYPAIDVERSLSRLIDHLVTDDHMVRIRQFRAYTSLYRKNEDMINIGAYKPGANNTIDQAILMYPKCMEFIKQSMQSNYQFDETLNMLATTLQETANAAMGMNPGG